MSEEKYSFENIAVNENIEIKDLFRISKMEDVYLSVEFTYGDKMWDGAVPLKGKYQSIDIPLELDSVLVWVNECYEALNPCNIEKWEKENLTHWETSRSHQTRLVFDALKDSNTLTKWECRNCGPVPRVNPQPGARIRSLKAAGYYIATRRMMCTDCKRSQFFDLLIRLEKNPSNSQKRNSISPKLRKRILNVLPKVDAATLATLKESECCIDHKFPSSRWSQGEGENADNMTDEEIKEKFQVLSNQSNLQKERHCQRCVIDGERGSFNGIKWYYEGDAKWRGEDKSDVKGCAGCPWYDVNRWREELNSTQEQ